MIGDKRLSRSDRPKITITGDGCRGVSSAEGRRAPMPHQSRDRNSFGTDHREQSFEILEYSRGQFPDHRPQTKRQEQYRDQTRSFIGLVLR